MTLRLRTIAIGATLLAFAVSSQGSRAAAPHELGPRWHEEKCVRYKKAWVQALAHVGTRGLGRDFLDRHEAFLASGCSAKADVCPRSAEELKLANVMVMLAMNFGTASTFPPFACSN